MNLHYILKDGQPVKAELLVWAKWFEKSERTVAKDEIGKVLVSTVFLGLDHRFGSGPPVLWETMIFGGEHNDFQERYTSVEDALEGHKHAVELVKLSSTIQIKESEIK